MKMERNKKVYEDINVQGRTEFDMEQSTQQEESSMNYETDYDIYSIDVSKNFESQFEIVAAISSLTESTNNVLEVVDINLETNSITRSDLISIEYPASKIMWSPMNNQGQDKQLIAVASDKLRLYDYSKSGIGIRKELKNTLLKDLSAPLTSFDWSAEKNYICCSSIDTTCSIFDINQEKFFKQLIAHDKEVACQCIRVLIKRPLM